MIHYIQARMPGTYSYSEDVNMATKNPRLNVVLEPSLMNGVDHLARAQGISLSAMARDLIKEALDTYEDGQWQKIAQKRETTFSGKKSLTHDEVWK
jgi:hypothetical protein